MTIGQGGASGLPCRNSSIADTFVEMINTHFAKIPYHASQHAKEGFYQALFLIFLEFSGIRAQGEVVTNQGRIDVLCELEKVFLYF